MIVYGIQHYKYDGDMTTSVRVGGYSLMLTYLIHIYEEPIIRLGKEKELF